MRNEHIDAMGSLLVIVTAQLNLEIYDIFAATRLKTPISNDASLLDIRARDVKFRKALVASFCLCTCVPDEVTNFSN